MTKADSQAGVVWPDRPFSKFYRRDGGNSQANKSATSVQLYPMQKPLDSSPKLVSDRAEHPSRNIPALDLRELAMFNHQNQETVAAIHEAGHAVGAFLLGIPIGVIVLDAAKAGEGVVRSPLTIEQIRRSGLPWEYAIVSMLGREAERIAFGRADRDFLGDDASNILGLYATFFQSEMTGQAFRKELRDRTAELLRRPGFREAIEALARVLLAERIVDGKRAAEVIQLVMDAYPSN
jgi:hypothetical protein